MVFYVYVRDYIFSEAKVAIRLQGMYFNLFWNMVSQLSRIDGSTWLRETKGMDITIRLKGYR